ncbi:hypothetical protein MJO29_008921 [Puccinia striiformis f. sp. tritici]|nr:hypothetical protein MJO29_008921 [Puccinia striiformis f. sp. tritici]
MTPSDPTMIREEGDYAAPWSKGKNKQPREEDEEDEEELAKERELQKVQGEAKIKEYAETIEELGKIAQELQEEEGVLPNVTVPKERVEDVEERVRQELSRPVNWSSDDKESSDDLGKIKEEVKTQMVSMGTKTAKAFAKILKLVPKTSQDKANKIKEDLREAIDKEIRSTRTFLEQNL